MIKLSPEQITSIAQELDVGMNCYVHKNTGKVITILAEFEEFDNTEIWQKELETVKNNRDQYVLIEKMESSDSFKIMRRFLGKVPDSKLREKLMIAISQNKPFQRFRNILNYNGDVLQDWYNFKQNELEKYVKRHFFNS